MGLRLPVANSRLSLITLLILLLSFLASSCAFSGGGSQYVGLMAMIPVDATEYHFWAVDRLGSEEGLGTLYKKFRDSTTAKQFGEFEPVLAVVKNSARASGFDGSVTVLQGDFNSRDIERHLKDQGYALSVHRDIGIWTPAAGKEGVAHVSVALRGDSVLMGTVEDLKACIDVIKLDHEDCLREDQSINWVTERLPDGLLVDVYRAGPESSEGYSDLISFGRSYSKEGNDKMRMTAVYMFTDGYAAGPAQEEIRGYLTGQGFIDVETKQEGNFIHVTAKINISDFTWKVSY